HATRRERRAGRQGDHLRRAAASLHARAPRGSPGAGVTGATTPFPQRGNTMKSSRRMTGVVGAVAALALLATGCAGGGGGGNDPAAEKVYIQAIADDPMGLNGQLVSGATPSMFSGQIFDTLIRINDKGDLSPGLAKEYELSEDGLTLTLTLQEGVTWHDGEPFTAEDVKFNLEEIVELQTFGSQLAARIASVEI